MNWKEEAQKVKQKIYPAASAEVYLKQVEKFKDWLVERDYEIPEGKVPDSDVFLIYLDTKGNFLIFVASLFDAE